MEEAYSIGYDEEPQYGRIIFMMEHMLLKMNCIPDKYYTWFQHDFIGRPISDIEFKSLASAKINQKQLEEQEDSEEDEQRFDMRSLITKNKRGVDK